MAEEYRQRTFGEKVSDLGSWLKKLAKYNAMRVGLVDKPKIADANFYVKGAKTDQEKYDKVMDSVDINTFAIAKLLADKGKYNSLYVKQYDEDVEPAGAASHRLNDMAVAGGKNRRLDLPVLHEITHALQTNPTKFMELQEKAREAGVTDEDFNDIILPKHWTEGKLDDYGEGNPFSRYKELAEQSRNRRREYIEGRIPVGEDWSGLTSETSGIPSERYDLEGSAYYYNSHPDTLGNKDDPVERGKEYAMYLMQHGVPFEMAKRAAELLIKQKRDSVGENLGYNPAALLLDDSRRKDNYDWSITR